MKVLKALMVVGVVGLSGCAVDKADPILGHWDEEGKQCAGRTFCGFSVTAVSGMKGQYAITFDKVPYDFPNVGVITPNYKGNASTYYYTNSKAHGGQGVMMYLDKGVLVETNRGTRFVKTQAGK